jgi:hypothetical protein
MNATHISSVFSGQMLETAMKSYKLLTLGAAIAIIALEALLFARASTDAPDIGIPTSAATSDSPSTPGDTP